MCRFFGAGGELPLTETTIKCDEFHKKVIKTVRRSFFFLVM